MGEKQRFAAKGSGRRPLNQKIYESLKTSILRGEIEPGTKLNEVQVAKQMNTSTTPVREAFRRLSSEGFVRIEPWKGVVVPKYDADEVLEVFQCREALETLGLELMLRRFREEPSCAKEIDQIEQAVQASHTASLSEFVYLDKEVHDLWIKSSGNHRLMQLLTSLNEVLLHDKGVSAIDEARKNQVVEEHAAILRAIRVLDDEAAKQALHDHLQKCRAYSLSIRG